MAGVTENLMVRANVTVILNRMEQTKKKREERKGKEDRQKKDRQRDRKEHKQLFLTIGREKNYMS